MKKLLIALSAALLLSSTMVTRADDPDGAIVYSLPSTTLTFNVEAVRENFYAGPYAKFAAKYLGIEVRQENAVTYQLTQVSMTPYVEADLSTRYVLAASGKEVSASFLKLCSTGLVSFREGNFGEESVWRFPSQAKGDFSERGVTSNLSSEEATLYRNVKNDSEYNKVAVQQNMVVEKSLEKRAAETASIIFNLRKKRVQIVTGDTDATYSGEAMGAAIEEITRLEKEYMSMFVGYSEFQTQKMRFDVVPVKDRESQKYVAFRISDSAGLVSADDISGKPVLLEIVPSEVAEPKGPRSSKGTSVYFRTPSVCSIRLINGSDVILQSRVPVYQLGVTSSFPVVLSVK